MTKHGVARVVKFVMIGIIAVLVFGFVVKWLWNWLMPGLFGLHAIGYWQALGLLILSKILFGGFRGGPGHRRDWRARFIKRWKDMTPEERNAFQAGMRAACGGSETAPGEPKV